MAVHDMSGIVKSLYGGGSMSGGNTTAPTPEFAPVGSDSEAERPTVKVPDPLDVPAGDHSSFVHADTDAFDGHGWSTSAVDSDGWTGTRP